jgi:hypothetical protein
MVEYLPSKHKVLISNPNTTKKLLVRHHSNKYLIGEKSVKKMNHNLFDQSII